MWSILENVPWALEKTVYSIVGWIILNTSVRSTLFVVLIDSICSWSFAYIFYPLLKVGYWRFQLLLKCLLFPSICHVFCFMHLGTLLLGTYVFIFQCPSLSLVTIFVLKSIFWYWYRHNSDFPWGIVVRIWGFHCGGPG